jgi:quercetin dioxygenase-like cupin family protein
MKVAQFHPKKTLVPRPISNGMRMWSVALEKTMFTYFEIDPESHFELHSHVNEQITMVLEGELFFKFSDRLVCVKRGEVIAIPSNIPHEAYTQVSHAIAVDAWSPVRDKFKQVTKVSNALENESMLSFCVGMKP